MKTRSSFVRVRPRKGRVALAIAGAVVLGALGASAPSGAAPATGQIVAAPGATLPEGNYTTRTVVVLRGNPAIFRNFDIAPHDVDSDSFLFSMPTIGTGKNYTIHEVAGLPDGNYPFHCSVHSWMKGQILVRR
jgi:plastocyanin